MDKDSDIKSIAQSVTHLLSVTAKLSDTVEVLAKSQITLEFHSHALDKLDIRAEKLEDRFNHLDDILDGKCNVQNKAIVSSNDKTNKRIDKEIDNVDKDVKQGNANTLKMFGLSMAFMTFVFGYFYLDMNELKEDSKTKHKTSMETLNVIKESLHKVETNQATEIIRIQHNSELLNELKNKHNKLNKGN